jgi:hypothetical protein
MSHKLTGFGRRVLARDYRGRRVRLTSNVHTKGGAFYPVGHIMEIVKKHGAYFNLECLGHCKLKHRPKASGDVGRSQHYVTKVSKWSVELL